jgi:hypothetical protein
MAANNTQYSSKFTEHIIIPDAYRAASASSAPTASDVHVDNSLISGTAAALVHQNNNRKK